MDGESSASRGTFGEARYPADVPLSGLAHGVLVTSSVACGRVAGWCAHVMEQHIQDRLIRPQSEYVGPKGLKLDR